MNRVLRELLIKLVVDDNPFYALDREVMPWDILEAKGFLVPIESAVYVSCMYGHEAEIHWSVNQAGENVPYLWCGDCGCAPIAPEKTRRWLPRLEPVLEQLVQKLGIRGVIQPVVSNVLWRLGRKKSKEIYYLRRMMSEERRLVLSELLRVPQAILITGTKETLEKLQQEMIDNVSLSLDSVASMDEQCEMVIDFEALRDIIGADDASDEKTKPKPTPKRGSRTAKMEKLVHEMEEHLRRARDHARITAENSCIELLPRPSLGDLAKRTGLSKMDISRCLNDPDAQILRYLWQQADDLKTILK